MNKHSTFYSWIKCLFAAPLIAGIAGCGPIVDGSTEQEIIQEIFDVQLSQFENQPNLLEIRVSGIVTSAGWTNPILEPIEYTEPPTDGIYEYTFYATPPEEASATVITPIEIIHQLDPMPEDLHGVRIFSTTNDVVAMLEVLPPTPVPAIINEISEAQLIVDNGIAGSNSQLTINVQGTVTSTGWTNPTLIAAQYIVAPVDGIYDFTFYATPPQEQSAPAITPIDVQHRINPIPANMTGVRIHSETNSIVVLLEAQAPEPDPEVIYEISEVQFSVLESFPSQLMVQVNGIVNSTGWTQPHLLPNSNLEPPANGIYEFTFYATPPSETSAPAMTPIELTHVFTSLPENFSGLRIYSTTNSIETLLATESPNPGSAEIYEVTNIQLSVVEGASRQLDINVTGNAESAGWTSPVLVPYQYFIEPADGIYDFTFYATPPVGNVVQVITPITATHRLTPLPDNFTGIRIHSATNSLVAMLDTTPPPQLAEVIYSITDVQVARAVNSLNQIDIAVSGLINSGGWSQPMLIPFEHLTPPADGYYDFTFYATPPDGPAGGAFGPIDVVHRLTTPIDMNGVRIHAQTNFMETQLELGPIQSACAFVSGNTFETAELYEGGAAIPPADSRYHWSISFTAEGTFSHIYSDVGGQGTYYCDQHGLQLLNSRGTPYVPEQIVVTIANQSINLPYTGIDRYYYLVTP